MKILFVGLRVGAGLISICKAVKNELDKIQGVETEYVDIYSENPKMAKFASEFYYKIVKKFPRLVMFGQKIAYGCSIKSKKSHFFLNKDVSVCKEEMMKYIDRHKPDLIFTPVNFVAIALDELINEKKTDIKYIFQMPDFICRHCRSICRNDFRHICSRCLPIMMR